MTDQRKPPTPARLQSSKQSVRVRLVCEGLPAHRFDGCDGRRNIRVELQTKEGHEPAETIDPCTRVFATVVLVKHEADDTPDFSGPAVHGRRGERFFYLSWSGEKGGRREMFRRAKIHLRELRETQLARAVKSGGTLVARIHALSRDGGPACASVPLLGGGWAVE